MLNLKFNKKQVEWMKKNVFKKFNMNSIEDLTLNIFDDIFDYIVEEFEVPLAMNDEEYEKNKAQLNFICSILDIMEDSEYF